MRCGFYETEITPPLGTTIFGYYGRRVNVGVSSKLYAKACVLEQDGKHCAMLVLDTLALPASFPDFIRQYVHDKTGIDPNAILIAATHAHTGFPTTDDLGVHKTPNVSENEPELHPELDKLSLEWIRLVSADAVVHAFRRLQEATVRFGTGLVDNISYVREYILDDGTVRTNPNYCKERIVKPCTEPAKALPLFFFEDAEGKPLGSIASFALHHDIISGTRISSDYSGVVARRMKEKFGMDFVSLFFAGFCGNINHANYMGEKRGEPFLKTYVETGNLLFAEMLRIIEKAEPVSRLLDVKQETVKLQKRQVPEGFVDSVKAVVQNPPPITDPMSIEDPYSDRMKYAASARVIEYYGQEPDKVFDVPVQVIRLGQCLIWAFPGEVFCQFGDKLRAASPTGNNMFVENANHTDHPYIPTKEMFLPYVYESTYYSARLEPDAGDIMTDKAIALAKTLFA